MVILILIPIVFVLLATIFWFIFKNIIKAISLTFLVFMVITGVFGFLVYKDVKTIKDKFTNEDKIILFEGSNGIFAGLKVNSLDFELDDLPELLSQEEMQNYQNSEALIFKVDIIKVVEKLPPTIEISSSNGMYYLNKEDFLEIINSKNAFDELIKITHEGNNLTLEQNSYLKMQLVDQFGSMDELKSIFSMMVLSQIMNESTPKETFIYMKDGTIKIYPDLFVFKIAKNIPDVVVDMVIKND